MHSAPVLWRLSEGGEGGRWWRAAQRHRQHRRGDYYPPTHRLRPPKAPQQRRTSKNASAAQRFYPFSVLGTRSQSRWRRGVAFYTLRGVMKSFPILLLALLALVLPVASRAADDYEARTFTGADGARLRATGRFKPRNFDATKNVPLRPLPPRRGGARDRQPGAAQEWRAALPQVGGAGQISLLRPGAAVSAGQDVDDGEGLERPEPFRGRADGADEDGFRRGGGRAQGIPDRPGAPLRHWPLDGAATAPGILSDAAAGNCWAAAALPVCGGGDVSKIAQATRAWRFGPSMVRSTRWCR